MATKYTFDSSPTYALADTTKRTDHTKRKHHRRHNSSSSNNNDDDDPTDGNASLTYSAASSINSAGESTDSSFADIMKVLDGQDTHELAAYLKHQANKHHRTTDEKSVAESLAYSTDAESHMRSLASNADASGLHGTELLSTITGQASHQMYDGGVGSQTREDPGHIRGDDDNLDILFSPAEHTDSLKQRKEKKRRSRQDAAATPRVKNSSSSRNNNSSPQYSPTSGSSPRSARSAGGRPSTRNNASSEQHRTSRPPKQASTAQLLVEDEEDVWYAKWWMFCFPDTVQNMTPKR